MISVLLLSLHSGQQYNDWSFSFLEPRSAMSEAENLAERIGSHEVGICWVNPLLDFRWKEAIAGLPCVLPPCAAKVASRLPEGPFPASFGRCNTLLRFCSNSLTINHVRVFWQQGYDAGNGVRIPVECKVKWEL